MRAESNLGPLAFMRALSTAEIPWLLIGRQAVVQYGAPLQTIDFDFWISPEPESAAALLKLVQDLELDASVADEQMAHRPIFSLFSALSKFDIFRFRSIVNLDGVLLTFDQVYRRRDVLESPDVGLTISLPCLEDLRQLKRVRDSAKDREDVRYLDAFLSESRSASDPDRED